MVFILTPGHANFAVTASICYISENRRSNFSKFDFQRKLCKSPKAFQVNLTEIISLS